MTKHTWNDDTPLVELLQPETPAAPRDQMWQHIAMERRRLRTRQKQRATALRLMLAIVILGAGYTGRWVQDSSRIARRDTVANTTNTPEANTLNVSRALVASPKVWVDTVFAANLASSDSLITAFRLAASNSGVQQALGPWARQLLGTTRLLVQANAVSDSTLMALVADLDLVLGQIAMAADNPAQESIDRRMAGDAIASTNIVNRLQRVLQPSNSSSSERTTNGTIQ